MPSVNFDLEKFLGNKLIIKDLKNYLDEKIDDLESGSEDQTCNPDVDILLGSLFNSITAPFIPYFKDIHQDDIAASTGLLYGVGISSKYITEKHSRTRRLANVMGISINESHCASCIHSADKYMDIDGPGNLSPNVGNGRKFTYTTLYDVLSLELLRGNYNIHAIISISTTMLPTCVDLEIDNDPSQIPVIKLLIAHSTLGNISFSCIMKILRFYKENNIIYRCDTAFKTEFWEMILSSKNIIPVIKLHEMQDIDMDPNNVPYDKYDNLMEYLIQFHQHMITYNTMIYNLPQIARNPKSIIPLINAYYPMKIFKDGNVLFSHENFTSFSQIEIYDYMIENNDEDLREYVTREIENNQNIDGIDILKKLLFRL